MEGDPPSLISTAPASSTTSTAPTSPPAIPPTSSGTTSPELRMEKFTFNPNATAFVPRARSSPSAPQTSSSPTQYTSSPPTPPPVGVAPPHVGPPFVIVMLGPPGSGKTSQGQALGHHFGFDFLSIPDRIRELRRTENLSDAHVGSKHYSSVTNNMLEEYVKRTKDSQRAGLIIEYVKTPEGSVVVEETCRRHGLKVDCTFLLDMEDIGKLMARVSNKGDKVKKVEDTNPQCLLSLIHDYMFVEKAFHNLYHTNQTFFSINVDRPFAQITADLIAIVESLRHHPGVRPYIPEVPIPASSSPEEDASIQSAAGSLVPPTALYLDFLTKKKDIMHVLATMQNFIGLNPGRDRRFPGSSVMAIDESAVKTICGNEHRYMVSKKAVGTRYLLVYLKPPTATTPASRADGEAGEGSPVSSEGSPVTPSASQPPAQTPNGPVGSCYLVDRTFSVFRAPVFQPEIVLHNTPTTTTSTGTTPSGAGTHPSTWGDMLLDGCLVPVSRTRAHFIVFDCLYLDGVRALSEGLDSRLERLTTRFPSEDAISSHENDPHTAPSGAITLVCKKYFSIRELPRLVSEVDSSVPPSPSFAAPQTPTKQLYPSDGLIFTPKKSGYKTNFDPNLFRWKPPDRYTVDFRLTENRQGLYDLQLSRMVGKELRDITFTPLDLNAQTRTPINQSSLRTMVGGIVECKVISPPPAPPSGTPPNPPDFRRAVWQLIRMRTDKTVPDREEVVTLSLQSTMDGRRLTMMYFQAAGSSATSSSTGTHSTISGTAITGPHGEFLGFSQQAAAPMPPFGLPGIPAIGPIPVALPFPFFGTPATPPPGMPPQPPQMSPVLAMPFPLNVLYPATSMASAMPGTPPPPIRPLAAPTATPMFQAPTGTPSDYNPLSPPQMLSQSQQTPSYGRTSPGNPMFTGGAAAPYFPMPFSPSPGGIHAPTQPGIPGLPPTPAGIEADSAVLQYGTNTPHSGNLNDSTGNSSLVGGLSPHQQDSAVLQIGQVMGGRPSGGGHPVVRPDQDSAVIFASPQKQPSTHEPYYHPTMQNPPVRRFQPPTHSAVASSGHAAGGYAATGAVPQPPSQVPQTPQHQYPVRMEGIQSHNAGRKAQSRTSPNRSRSQSPSDSPNDTPARPTNPGVNAAATGAGGSRVLFFSPQPQKRQFDSGIDGRAIRKPDENGEAQAAVDERYGGPSSRTGRSEVSSTRYPSSVSGTSSQTGSTTTAPGHAAPSYRDFMQAVHEWLIRKFTPRPSAARPRPYTVLGLGCRAADLPLWDRGKAAKLVGCDANPDVIRECQLRASRDLEMEVTFFVGKAYTQEFRIPKTVTDPTFDVLSVFTGLECGFGDEGMARHLIRNLSRHLRKGGVVLITALDSVIIQDRVVEEGTQFGNSEFRFEFYGDLQRMTDRAKPFGHQYVLRYGDGTPSYDPTYIVLGDTLKRLCNEYGLESLPEDHGDFNFHDVATYIEKSVSKGHVWRELSESQRCLVELWCTYVFQKVQ